MFSTPETSVHVLDKVDRTRATEETVRYWWQSGSRCVRVKFRVGLGLRLDGGIPPYPARQDVLPGACLIVTVFATSAALAEVCALLSTVLVILVLYFVVISNVCSTPRRKSLCQIRQLVHRK